MALKIHDAGTLRTITRGYVKQAGILRTLREIKVMDGGTLRTVAVFADPLTVTASGAYAEGESSTLTTDSATASPSGGFAPYTYSWALLTNGGGGASTAATPSMASTTFTKTGVSIGATFTDTWRVTVTDSSGQTATADVSATFYNRTGAV